MIKVYTGIPKHFKALYWLSDLKSMNITLKVLLNPFNFQTGLNYKLKDKAKTVKSMSIVWDEKIPEDVAYRIIRTFEVDEFGIPDGLSAYSKLIK